MIKMAGTRIPRLLGALAAAIHRRASYAEAWVCQREIGAARISDVVCQGPVPATWLLTWPKWSRRGESTHRSRPGPDSTADFMAASALVHHS